MDADHTHIFCPDALDELTGCVADRIELEFKPGSSMVGKVVLSISKGRARDYGVGTLKRNIRLRRKEKRDKIR